MLSILNALMLKVLWWIFNSTTHKLKKRYDKSHLVDRNFRSLCFYICIHSHYRLGMYLSRTIPNPFKQDMFDLCLIMQKLILNSLTTYKFLNLPKNDSTSFKTESESRVDRITANAPLIKASIASNIDWVGDSPDFPSKTDK